MKILFFIPSLATGGAERIASLLCNYWSKNGNEVFLLTFDAPQNDFFVINDSITRRCIGVCNTNNSDDGSKNNILKKIYLNIIRLLRVRKAIISVRPDVVVSFSSTQNIITLIACLFTEIPVVISEVTYPQYFNDGNFFDWIRKIIYKLSNAFVSQTSGVAAWAQEFICATKIKVIPSPLDVSKVSKDGESSPIRQNYILAVGRLAKEKGFDLLIEAYCKCCKDYPKWRLLIVGDGEERGGLEEQIAKLELEKYVILVGKVSDLDLEMHYKSSKFFVLSSRVEGFPTVLIEAMAYGLPVISFDCKAGPSDIIRNGENGLLVPNGDINALSEAMKKLMDDEILREKISEEALKVRDKYNIELVSKQWIDLLRWVVDERKKQSQYP